MDTLKQPLLLAKIAPAMATSALPHQACDLYIAFIARQRMTTFCCRPLRAAKPARVLRNASSSNLSAITINSAMMSTESCLGQGIGYRVVAKERGRFTIQRQQGQPAG